MVEPTGSSSSDFMCDFFCFSEGVPILAKLLNISNHSGGQGWTDSSVYIKLILKCLVIVMKYMQVLDELEAAI